MNKKYEIAANDLKQYVSSIRSCRYISDGSIEIEPSGSVSFDFSDFNNIAKCITFKGRRLSGNGTIIIATESSHINTKFSSMHEETIQVPTSYDKIKIMRQPGTFGKILISGIIIETNEDIEIMQDEEVVKSMSWRNIIAQCEPCKNVRIVKNKLFASEGGSLKSSNIESIITQPPNVIVNKDGFIKFMIPCEILDIKLSSLDKIHSEPMYRNMESPPTITTNYDINSNKSPNELIKNKTFSQVITNNIFVSSIMYDSSQSGLNINAFGSVVGSLSNVANGIIMPRGSSFCIPITTIQPDFEYVVVITANKINGNGKLEVSIIDDDNNIKSVITLLAHQKKSELFFKLKSGSPAASYKIKISRGSNSVGELFVERIKLINGIKNASATAVAAVPTAKINAALFYQPVNFNYNTDNIIQNPIILNTLSNVPLSDNINLSVGKDKKFVIVIPSYNNEQWVENNLRSAIQQNYTNYRIIYIDDCSSDKTFIKAREIIDKYNGNIKTIIVKNINRLGALENLYNAIHSCADDEIILTLDGDDWLSNENVLNYLNNVYKNEDVWLTYGQYQNYPDGGRGISQQIPDKIIQSNGYRSFTWCSSHLRTFYAWLFKKINKNDLINNDGKFFAMTWDLAIMYPMLEMSGIHSKFISEALYTYNLQNPINDHKVNKQLQASLDGLIRRKTKYNKTSVENKKQEIKHKIGLIIIGTSKYQSFIAPLISSADRYFFNNADSEVSYFVFSDETQDILTTRSVKQVHIEHVPFPFASMNRFKYFSENKEIFNDMDYLYYIDADCLFINRVSGETLGDLVGVRHCGYYHGGGTFETNTSSCLYTPSDKYTYYYGGGFSGGRKDKYLELSEWCASKIEQDVKNGIIPLWHDETAINRYFLDHAPLSLSPSYHYPQNIEKFKHLWKSDNFDPIILLLEKHHEKIRT
jgi:glycosyltransferase involved in cell wall biosynthesis